MQRATSAAEQLLERGVYRAPYLVDGSEVLIAIDSRGVARKHVKLRDGVNEARATEWLRGLLDRLDPVDARPRLELVKPSPAPSFDWTAALDNVTAHRMARDPKLRARLATHYRLLEEQLRRGKGTGER